MTSIAATRPPGPSVGATERTGTRVLLRLAARRDRVMVPVWYAVLVLTVYASAAATPTVWTTEAERVQAARAINSSPGLVAIYGPILDVHSEGELAMTKMTVLYAVFVALMLIFVVRRHTRLDEESGQSELLAGTAIDRLAPLRAAVLFGAGVSLVLGVLTALANIAGGLPVLGSVAFGALWAGIGLVATGLAAFTCQLSASARTCAAISVVVVGVLFALRAVGDTTAASWLSWISPFGWNTQVRAYSGTRWWVLLLYVALAAALTAVAYTVRRRRDLGAGVIEPRPGPATGSPRLADALALSFRVHTPMIIGWTLGIGAWGLIFGAITPSFDAFDTGNIADMLQKIGGSGAFRDILLGAIIAISAIVVTSFAIVIVVHGGTDERDGRTEQVLATATSRRRTFLATVIVALVGATWLLLVLGVTIALSIGNDTDQSFGRLVGSALAQAPAVWVVVALAVLCFAWRSSAAILGWALVLVFVTLGQLGELLHLPQWVSNLSPYEHAPQMPVEPFEIVPALVLTAIAAAVLGLAWLRYRVRDIT